MELMKKKSSELLSSNKEELKAIGLKASQIDLEVAMKDASEHFISAKKAIVVLEAYLIGMKDAVHDECYSVGEKNPIKRYGTEISLGSTGDRLDYEKDSVYAELKKQLKKREEVLKLVTKGGDEMFDKDGALIEAVPIKSASREILKIKL